MKNNKEPPAYWRTDQQSCVSKAFLGRNSEKHAFWGEGGEMTQTLYAHMNKKKKTCFSSLLL
jgi:hypothetical protein